MAIVKRRCIGGAGPCSDGGYAVRGKSRCRNHGGGAWARQPAQRQAEYSSPEYKTNRLRAIEREPTCHWKLPGCTLKSTTADHLLSVARGGGSELANLVGSCDSCNKARGAAEGRATRKRKRLA